MPFQLFEYVSSDASMSFDIVPKLWMKCSQWISDSFANMFKTNYANQVHTSKFFE